MSENIKPIFDKMLSKQEKEKQLHQRAKCIWFTGLSGSGKSTLATLLEKKLFELNFATALLDGDNIRFGLNKDLGFSDEERIENIRRIAEVNKLFNDNGIITINTFVSPTNYIRSLAKEIIGNENFFLIYVNASIETCESRDVKGLYKKARKGEINDFTGISAPFEEPDDAQLIIDTNSESIENNLKTITEYILKEISL
ncbi:MAG TPA: adenylyl-sulfate kinase [Bacteroidales bacterium]|jgi:adenylylsulfate kinase|nr:adenylyl-sulfate kinase [Bacteroidales bacterium]HNV95577.1 adenylyl-sulfate kinase [Bacteroidales bacterium]HOU97786.1 adenylyl-sulfate kinase [Bacteroidales bacterium]